MTLVTPGVNCLPAAQPGGFLGVPPSGGTGSFPVRWQTPVVFSRTVAEPSRSGFNWVEMAANEFRIPPQIHDRPSEVFPAIPVHPELRWFHRGIQAEKEKSFVGLTCVARATHWSV